MAVYNVFGMTQSGKSHLSEHVLLNQWKRRLIFDAARCFQVGEDFRPLVSADPKKLQAEITRLWKSQFTYRYRPDRTEDRVPAFDNLVRWACILGRKTGERVQPEDRVVIVADEADRLCSPSFASRKFDYLINEGRHDNVDSIFICRDPNNLFIDARKNASVIITFQNPLAPQMSFFKGLVGKELCKKISLLPKFHYLTWRDTGAITITDHRGKIYLKQGCN